MAKKVMAQKENNGMSRVSMSQTYEGPLPTPADFSAYIEALPSAPERIMVMAEEEQHYRQKLNNKVVNFGIVESICGMVVAFLLLFYAWELPYTWLFMTKKLYQLSLLV